MKTRLVIYFTLFLLFLSVKGWSQQIPFPQNQHKDSLSLQKYMPILAQKTIAVYKDVKNPNYKDNLFRLQLVGHQYKAVPKTLRELAQEKYGDSTKLRALGVAFRWYANVLQTAPKTKKAFAETFRKQFQKQYAGFDSEGQNIVEGYYNKDLTDLKADWDTKRKNTATKDALSVQEAIELCRSYCSYTTFNATLALAKQLLKEASDNKYLIDENVVLTMKDGGTVSLTLVRAKSVTTPQPVVLKYNIYAAGDIPACKDAANRGYVGVIANTRGKRLSDDETEPFEHDAKDSYEIIDWISKQPWCNGKVGMYGGSYLGFSQWSAVKYKHPALKTIVPQVSVGVGIDFPMQTGVFYSYMLRWIHYVTNTKATDLSEFRDTAHWNKVDKEFYTSGKPFRKLDSIEGRPNVLFQRWLSHPVYDSFWQNMTPQQEEFTAIDIPILTTTGYYDDDQLGAMYYYNEYQKWNKNDNYYLLIGPYDHFGAQGYPQAMLNDYKIDEVANIPIQEIVFQWFDYTLKDGPKPDILKDKVNYQVMGANTWQHAPSLDKMTNAALTFYVGSNNKLTEQPEAPSNYITQEINFKDRSDYKEPKESADYAFEPKTLPEDKNLIVLESQPLEATIILSGNPKAYLDIEINKKDVDLVFQLYEKETRRDLLFPKQ